MEETRKMVKMPTHKRIVNGFTYEPPARCCNCDRDLRAKEWPEGSPGPYIQIMMPIPGICLYQCLKCSAVMGNVHAMNNMKIVKELQSTPQIMRPESRIIKLSS
jgi:hypothetical protein